MTTLFTRAVQALRIRIRDWMLERKIARVHARTARLLAAKRYAEARDEFQTLRLLTSQRSTTQVLRMERAQRLQRVDTGAAP